MYWRSSVYASMLVSTVRLDQDHCEREHAMLRQNNRDEVTCYIWYQARVKPFLVQERCVHFSAVCPLQRGLSPPSLPWLRVFLPTAAPPPSAIVPLALPSALSP